MHDSERQSFIDEEHLRLLRLGYFVSAGMAAFFASFGLLYAAMGVMMGVMSKSMPHGVGPQAGPPAEMGWVFGIFGLLFTTVGLTIAGLRLRAAKCVRERRSRVFCLVMAAISCVEVPYGTAFGILAFSVLSRGSVRGLFHEGR